MCVCVCVSIDELSISALSSMQLYTPREYHYSPCTVYTLSYRNEVDLSMSTHKESALTTTTNPAYEIMKHGGVGRHEYELGGSAETDPTTADVTYYEIPFPPSHQPQSPSHQPPSHQPLSTVPLSVAPGVVTYYEIPFPPSHQPPSSIPLSVAPGIVGVASGGGEEGVYDIIPEH